MHFFKSQFAVLLFLATTFSQTSQAADTVCNDNGGLGWAITDFGTTNLSIPFNFGDISILHDVNVSTDITHTYVGDLTVRATSPDSGTQITLFERPGTPDPEFSTPTSFGCWGNDINATFDDESLNPSIENELCDVTVPIYSGDYLPHDAAPNNLSAFDNENPNGNWSFYLSDSANQDTGTLNEVCLTVAYAAVTFDKWVSSNVTCSDNIDSLAVAPGTDVYFCYTVENPSTETFIINPGDATDSEGHDLSGLERTYNQNDTHSVVVGPLVAGTDLPVGSTVNNASVTGTFATVNYTGTLTTPETATAVVGNPTINTSTKTVIDINGGGVEPGDVLQYTITINETAGIYTPGVTLTDVVDANLGSITITSIPAGATDNTVGSNISITGIDLPANGTQVVVFEAMVGGAVPAGTNIKNTATIAHAASAVSYDAIAPTLIVSAPDLSTSTKAELDVDGAPALAGDLVRYTITINETAGNPATNITVTDVVDANLTSVNVISIPAGATDNTVGNNIDVSNINIAASGSASIIFEANISPGASVGTVISNTATIEDLATGASAIPAAGTIIVGSSPTAGMKQLYFTNLNSTRDLTRTVTAANTNVNVDVGGPVDIDQSIVFQSPFTISGGSTASAFITMRRRGGGGARTAQVDLYNGNTGTLIGTASQTWNAGGNQYLTFNYPIAADVNFAAGDFVRIRVTNTSANGRRIQVRSLINGNISQVQMQSSTVINVDTTTVYSTAYPGTTQFLSYAPSSTVYLRATVRDPFGNADINGANITITDSTPTVQVNAAAMSSVATPSGETEIYEYAYTLPATPDGTWSVSVTANEGTEGTVSHTGSTNMTVGNASLIVSKNSLVISDPINISDYKAVPGAIVEYTLNVQNTGFGYIDTDSFVITDPLPAGTTFYFGSPLNVANFTDGANSSGLSFTFTTPGSSTDDIDFSNDGGSTYITPNVDANGYDITSPPVNYIRINPKGGFNGSDGINHPSMSIRFRLKLD